ncbi:leukotriene-B4 omega-hydroxylase 3-like [Pecten maximus]|uniref:leukotriene-B4 omega-hydroxylase 3-like n=1 Tax=Pecten maximus TaxID=6579 RepID=UPI001457F07A|nr:leukotriene-B4 omega-hydroxylase 3-like [Pecten maximus]
MSGTGIVTISAFTPGNVVGTLVLGLVIYVLYEGIRFLLHVRYLSNVFRDVPGPDNVHWLYGNILQSPSNGEKRLEYLKNLVKRFPRFYRLWIGPKPVIMLTHPDTIKILLKTAEPKTVGFGGAYRHGRPWLGDGLLIAGGQRWARSRRLLTPAFHFDVLRPYTEVYNEASEELLKNIGMCAEKGESFETFHVVSACTLDIILRCAFSYCTNCQNLGKSHPYVTAVNEIAEEWATRNKKPWLFPDIIFYLTKGGRRFKRQCKYVHDVAEDVIDKRRRTLEAGGVPEKKYKDFLDILLMARDENGKGLTREEIRNEVDTFLFEGHDTTASAISWILYSLATHPEHQAKVQEEIDHVLEGRESDRLQWEDMPKLEYLTLCIKEGMRLHSPVPFIQRESTREFIIDGKTLPPGTNLSCSIFSVHHNPTVWSQSDKFIPQRFSKENIAQMDSFAFLPFAAGPRNCIGQTFAMNEEKVVIARILQRYTIELDPTVEVKKHPAAVMRSKNGVYLYARARR